MNGMNFPKISLFILMVVLLLFWLIPSNIENGACAKADLFFKIKMSHLVIGKYIDESNRNIGVVKLSKEVTKNSNSLVLYPNTSEYELFEYIKIGDTLVKDRNTLLFKVNSLNRDKKSFKLNFSCDDYR